MYYRQEKKDGLCNCVSVFLHLTNLVMHLWLGKENIKTIRRMLEVLKSTKGQPHEN